jgi:hypothetical protein
MEVVDRVEHLRGFPEGSGKYARMSDPEKLWVPVEHTPSPHGVPTSAMFDDGNGGEYRKSLHVYAPPFAQLVDSPDKINGIAMQVDTWHREKMNVSGSVFVPGPYPRRSLAPTAGPDAIYSGLLECPLTSRIRKTYASGSTGGFNDSLAAQALSCASNGGGGMGQEFCVKQGVNGISGAVPQPGAAPQGLSYAGVKASAQACEAACVAGNHSSSSSECLAYTWISPAFAQRAWHNMCYLRHSGLMSQAPGPGIVTGWRVGAAGAPASCTAGGPAGPGGGRRRCEHAVADAATCFGSASSMPGLASLGGVGRHLSTKQVSSAAFPAGCSVAVDSRTGARSIVYNTNTSSEACCGTNPGTELSGRVPTLESNVTVALQILGGANGTAVITLRGPADVYFAVGWAASTMSDRPYTIVVEPPASAGIATRSGAAVRVSERKLDKHAPGKLLSSSLTVVSSTVSEGMRTVVLRRPLRGATPDHYSFGTTTPLALPLITAVGQGAAFGPHGAAPHGASTLHLWPSTPVCICAIPAAPFGAGQGTMTYEPTGSTVSFRAGRCDPQPREDLIAQRNPTCDIRSCEW